MSQHYIPYQEHNERKKQAKRDTVQENLADTEHQKLQLAILREKRERWLFWVAIASLFVSGGSLYVASLALYFSYFPR